MNRYTRHKVIAFIVTLLGLGGLGLLLMYVFQHATPAEVLRVSPGRLVQQVGIGMAFGLFCGTVLALFLQHVSMRKTVAFFKALAKRYELSVSDAIFLSAAAGIGEELLFRGAVQYWLGIWITASIFIFLHGYIQFRNIPLLFYGTILLIVSAGFGYLMSEQGIWAAMSAHFSVDLVLMLYLRPKHFM
ncbi:MAG: CPBP family intramembrane glutamic endopeptidase [Chitinophagales bacterium]